MAWFLSRNYCNLLGHDLMVAFEKKAISILVRNLNSGCIFLATKEDEKSALVQTS